MSSEHMRSTLRVTKGLADLQRTRILMLLQAGELCVCQIVEVLGLAPSTVSKHLSILTTAGLVYSRKVGRWAYYRLPDGAADARVRHALKWLAEALKADETIQRDTKTLKRVIACAPEYLSRRQKHVRRGDSP